MIMSFDIILPTYMSNEFTIYEWLELGYDKC